MTSPHTPADEARALLGKVLGNWADMREVFGPLPMSTHDLHFLTLATNMRENAKQAQQAGFCFPHLAYRSIPFYHNGGLSPDYLHNTARVLFSPEQQEYRCTCPDNADLPPGS